MAASRNFFPYAALYTAGVLPSDIPVLALEDAILLPGGRLPLRLAEARHIAILNQVFTTPLRLLAIGQHRPRGGNRLYDIVGAGRVVALEEDEDGTCHIQVAGIQRCRLVREIRTRAPYRKFEVSWEEFTHDRLHTAVQPVDRSSLLSLMRRYFEKQGLYADWPTIQAAPLDKLIISLSMVCPFSGHQKQTLLEAYSMLSRLNLLLSFMDLDSRSEGESDAQQEIQYH